MTSMHGSMDVPGKVINNSSVQKPFWNESRKYSTQRAGLTPIKKLLEAKSPGAIYTECSNVANKSLWTDQKKRLKYMFAIGQDF